VRRLTLLPLVLAAALVAGGCGERAEPLGPLDQDYPVTIRGAGEAPVVLRGRPERVVALDAGSAELVAALGAAGRLVGAPPGIVESATEVVDSSGQIAVGAVVRLEPDLVIATPATDRVAVDQIARRTEAPVYVQPALTIEDVERAAIELGFALGEPVTARQLVGELRRVARSVDDRLAEVAPVTTFVDTGFFITVPEQSLLGGLVARAKGTNVAREGAGLGPFDVEKLAELDPDVYLTTSDSGTTIAKLQRRAETRDLSAVQEGRFHILDAALVTRAGPRVALAYGEIAAALHPDAFR
jgi:ABC-type Fe3+-hydroxamate transport system substrate-binding protein